MYFPQSHQYFSDSQGRKKITAITRYVTVGLALFESVAMAIGFGRQGLIPNMNFFKGLTVVACLTAGSAMLMWIGERITEKGVGNGISIVLTINIVSRIPSDLSLLYENFIKGKTIAKGLLAGLIILAIIVVMVVFVLILNGAERRIPVQYSRKMVGRKLMGGQTTNIPLKVNTAGVTAECHDLGSEFFFCFYRHIASTSAKICLLENPCRSIAPDGQVTVHAPQPWQRALFTTAILLVSRIPWSFTCFSS